MNEMSIINIQLFVEALFEQKRMECNACFFWLPWEDTWILSIKVKFKNSHIIEKINFRNLKENYLDFYNKIINETQRLINEFNFYFYAIWG